VPTGFITIPEFVALTSQSLATIERLEKFRAICSTGMTPRLSSLLAHRRLSLPSTAATSLPRSTRSMPVLVLFHTNRFSIPSVFWTTNPLVSAENAEWRARSARSTGAADASAACPAWIAWLSTAAAAHAPMEAHDENPVDNWWISEARARIVAILELLHDYMPWLLPEYAPLRELPELLFKQDAYSLTIEDASAFAAQLEVSLRRACSSSLATRNFSPGRAAQ